MIPKLKELPYSKRVQYVRIYNNMSDFQSISIAQHLAHWNVSRAFCVQYTVLVSYKGALCGPTTCADPVGIMDWREVLFMSLRIWHLWGSTILES